MNWGRWPIECKDLIECHFKWGRNVPMMSRKKLSIMLALGCVKLVKEKKGKNIYLARSHIWAFFTKVGIHLKAFLMGHFKWCHINVMYGTLSPMIVPHKCCFIWLRHFEPFMHFNNLESKWPRHNSHKIRVVYSQVIQMLEKFG